VQTYKVAARCADFGVAEHRTFRPTRRDDVMAFYGDAATIKDMKGLLHNG
jgi:hypothetical protein